jgi:hypothetical protein
VPTLRQIVCVCLVPAVLACHRSAPPGSHPTPVDSLATIAVTRPVCTIPSGSGDAVGDKADVRWPVGQLTIPDSIATTDTARTVAVRLPARFQPTTPRHPERRRWESPDSTAIELWLSETPVSSVGGSGVAKFGGEVACTVDLGGRAPAIVVRYWMILAGRSDTLYNAATAAFVAPSQAVDAVISGRTRASRDELLGVLSNLEVPAVTAPSARASR